MTGLLSPLTKFRHAENLTLAKGGEGEASGIHSDSNTLSAVSLVMVWASNGPAVRDAGQMGCLHGPPDAKLLPARGRKGQLDTFFTAMKYTKAKYI